MKVLIIDDSVDFASTIADIIKSFKIEAEYINSPYKAISYMEHNYENINLILLDIEFGIGETINGLDLLEIFRRQYVSIPVVMISGKGTIETAVKATKLGAVNFIEKNIVTREKIRGILDTVLQKDKTLQEVADILKYLASVGIIGNSKQTIKLGEDIVRYGRTDLNVLVSGEAGVGKKTVAKAIHKISKRSQSNFIPVDIPNLTRENFQTELFGSSKYNIEKQQGLFQQANKGTLFLYEISELPVDLQSQLLLPIDSKKIIRNGDSESKNIDVRCIASTNKNLLPLMEAGYFRENLYHRLRECEIVVPTLADRIEDIPDIVNYFITIYNNEFNKHKYFSPSAIDLLKEHKWPGNVRELSSFVKTIIQTYPKMELEASDISNELLKYNKAKIEKVSVFLSSTGTLKEELAAVDKIKIEQTLLQTNGNVSKAAAALSISRESLHNKIRRYEIDVKQFRKIK